MIKRAQMVELLKQMKIARDDSDGPTCVIVKSGEGKGPQSFSLSVKNGIITTTTGRFLWKRRYKIHRNELNI